MKGFFLLPSLFDSYLSMQTLLVDFSYSKNQKKGASCYIFPLRTSVYKKCDNFKMAIKAALLKSLPPNAVTEITFDVNFLNSSEISVS